VEVLSFTGSASTVTRDAVRDLRIDYFFRQS